ncbi:hypothetical protein GGR92_005263 [Spirosoma lacussanchae]|uniref:hypothetical protein n=1 Tax=Spirosoma lacussanchae TaxID=1884249 RepID=UPI001107F694|nr:hypothetical protein [Spirosoma lacussanchae]
MSTVATPVGQMPNEIPVPQPVAVAQPPVQQPAPTGFDATEARARLSALGFKVYTAEEEQALRKTVESEAIGKKTSEFALKTEEDIFKATGIPKLSPDEKYFDYAQRAVKEAAENGKRETVQQSNRAIAEIALSGALGSMNFNLEGEALEMQRELLLNKALLMPHRVEGRQVIFQKQDPADPSKYVDIVDATTNEPVKAFDHLASTFKAFLKVATPPATGPNAKAAAPVPGAGPVPKNKAEAQQIALEKANGQTGPDYAKEYARLVKEYALTE